jgi:lipid II:glycine glycyltransferase (peptidoglycan interpeptide bridge formation enzyme)
LVLCRRLGPGISFAYVPWGPELPEGFDAAASASAAAELAAALRPLLPRTAAFIRFDLPWYSEEGAPASASPLRPFVRAAADVQPPDTALVNLAAEEVAILGAMKPKWRYNVGLAEKKGVALRVSAPSLGNRRQFDADFESYYRIYKETAERDGISIHGAEYYRSLFELASDSPEADIRLYMASHEGEDIAGIVTLFRGVGAVYLYGASASHKRNLMAPYALQWRAMRDAKAAGCLFYDLFGIPPSDDPNHPMAGLYRFKTGFGGRIIHRPGSWDYPYRPLAKAL